MASKYLQKYPVPEGFQEILHDFTREVLRDQPDDIVKYAAEYFECLQQGRAFNFESKFNISKNKQPHKGYNPVKAEDLVAQAKNVVDRSNSGAQRVPSATKRIPSASSGRQPSHASSKESYADEKKVTRQFVGELYSKVVDEICDGEDQQQEQEDFPQEQEGDFPEDEPEQQQLQDSEQFVNRVLFIGQDHKDMQKIVKIQSHVRGSQVRSKGKVVPK